MSITFVGSEGNRHTKPWTTRSRLRSVRRVSSQAHVVPWVLARLCHELTLKEVALVVAPQGGGCEDSR
eukprot:11208165-Lingulodinium_polyedra.AAC.2